MTLPARRIILLALASLLIFSLRSAAQDSAQKITESPKRETTGTKKDVEKRLKAAEKPKAAANPALDSVVKTIFATHTFQQIAVSPDGSHIAWVEDLYGKDGAPSGHSAIYVKSLSGNAKPLRITAGTPGASHAENAMVWSHDGSRLVFLSDAAKAGQPQVYAISDKGGAARQLTSVKGFLNSVTWSPDDKTIAVLFTENATRASGPLVAETHDTGEIKDAFFEQRLALIDVATHKLRQITPADTYIYEYDWAPDGAHFAVTAALGNGDNNWWLAELYTLDAATGLMKSIYKPKYQLAQPVFSPDGQQIAFIEGLMSDEGLTGGDIYTLATTGGDPRDLTQNMKASATWIGWQSDAAKILFSEIIGGNSGIATVDLASGKVEQHWSGEGTFSSGTAYTSTLSASTDHQVIGGVFQSFAHAPEVAVISGESIAPAAITSVNAALKPAWGDAKSLTWRNEGKEVQGWLLYPRDFDSSKKYPMVVTVHGGPSYASLSHWPGTHDFSTGLAGMGYFVFFPNPRGSYGQGAAFQRANQKDFGYGDFKDILRGVDEVLGSAPVDSDRLGITGWSYGGYMTMWAVTQTNRFKAAMAGAGLSNFQSYYGENSIDQWMIPFFGKSVYDDPEVYARSSPITFIKKVKTPTLILVGDSDGEVPAPQSFEFWHALKTLGVETQLVVYDHEGHMFATPAHQRDVIERTLAWFDAHLR